MTKGKVDSNSEGYPDEKEKKSESSTVRSYLKKKKKKS